MKPEKIYRTIKCPIKSVIKNENDLSEIKDITILINELRYHVLSFTKLYFIHLFDTREDFPIIDRSLFMCIIRCFRITKGKAFAKNINLYNQVKKFYDDKYRFIYNTKKEYVNLNSIIYYMIEDMIKDIENNIKMHFYNHLKKYFQSKYNIRNVSIDEKKAVYKLINHDIKVTYESTYLRRIIFHDVKISIPYDLKYQPQKYLYGMFYMARACEYFKDPFLNVFPLKRSIVPGHIRIDTEVINNIFLKGNSFKKHYKSNLTICRNEIWNHVFKMDKKVFNVTKKSNYIFSGSIQTDGISISILHEQVVNELPKKSKEMYIDEISNSLKMELKDKNIISIDPNKQDLIYCTIGEKKTNDLKHFRYTQNQRCFETKKRRFRKILEIEKKKDLNGIDVLECENLLSSTNSKTTNYELFKNYIIVKNNVYNRLQEFYNQDKWRKARLHLYVNTRKSEEKMINNFKEKLGNPKDSIIAFGDWSQKEQMKFHEPTKGKSFRSLFRRYGYKVYLVDEYRTSKKCCNCKCVEEGNCINFLKIASPRPWRREYTNLCHGLVKCKTCDTMFNRDVNSSMNIREITKMALENKSRPDYLQRNHPITKIVTHKKGLGKSRKS